ncbi:MAG: PAS domain S-box protein [Betaproteobacteria bacterium]|nr:PAS domain S-box protein [Betaproteobacteria bacterium]
MYRFSAPLAAAILAFLLSAMIATCLIWLSEKQNLLVEQTRIADVAKDHAHALESNIEQALSATYTLAALVRQGKGEISNLEEVAGHLLRYYPGVSSLALSPGGVIRHAVPLAGNEKTIGFDQLKDPVQSKEAFIARDTGKLTLAGPMFLVQGGMGAVGRLPVFLNDAMGKSYFWGFTNVVIRFPDVLVGARLPQLIDQGIDYQLWRIHPESGEKLIIAASSPNALIDPIEQNLDLAYGNWTLSVAPTNGWGNPRELWFKSVLGLLFSLLLSYMALLVMKLRIHRTELEHKVAGRTQALAKANEDLAGRESLLKQILDTSSVAIFLVDMQGRITKANRRMAEMFGWPVEMLEGNEYVALVHPSEREIGRQKMLALLASTIPSVDLDRLYCRADHTEFWGHLTGRRFYDNSGKEHGLIGVIADITERKRIEEKLQQQNKVLSAVIENFPGAISLFDANFRLAAYNNQFKMLLGLPDSLFEKPDVYFEDFIRYNAERGEYGPGDPEKLVTAIVNRARDFQPHKIERVRSNGTALEIRGMPLPGGGFVTTYVDITERKQAEKKLSLAASVFTHALEGIAITDAEGKIIDVNDTFSFITGYSRDEVLGHNPRILSSGRHSRDFFTAMWRSLTEKGQWFGEIWNRRKNGEVYAETLNISAVLDAQGKPQQYVALFSDITERKQIEGQVQELAFYDPLTKLPNRRLLSDRLSQAMAACRRIGFHGALMFLDLDNFKPLNDKHGHVVGDLLLIEAAARLKSCVREMDTVARFGGDEFVVMISELDVDVKESAEQAGIIAEKIRAALSRPYLLKIQREGNVTATVEHHCTASIGVVLFGQHEAGQDDLLKCADAAMYQAKQEGRNLIRFYEPNP